MKIVRFETVRELALALLDGRRFEFYGSIRVEFNESLGGFVVFCYVDEDMSGAVLSRWTKCDLTEIPTPRHHAELIKAWAEDDSLEIHSCQFPDGDGEFVYAGPYCAFSPAMALRLQDKSGSVIMVSEGKKQ